MTQMLVKGRRMASRAPQTNGKLTDIQSGFYYCPNIIWTTTAKLNTSHYTAFHHNPKPTHPLRKLSATGKGGAGNNPQGK